MPTLSNTFCAECNRFMKPLAIGVVVEEKMNDGQPYKLWLADILECPVCEKGVIVGFGQYPLAEHFDPHYERRKKIAIDSDNFYEESEENE